jgi:hypothetical protein
VDFIKIPNYYLPVTNKVQNEKKWFSSVFKRWMLQPHTLCLDKRNLF